MNTRDQDLGCISCLRALRRSNVQSLVNLLLLFEGDGELLYQLLSWVHPPFRLQHEDPIEPEHAYLS